MISSLKIDLPYLGEWNFPFSEHYLESVEVRAGPVPVGGGHA